MIVLLKNKIKETIRQVEQGYAWPGGYPVFAVMKDGSILCPHCVKENRKLIYIDSIGYSYRSGWEIEGSEINWEDIELSCDHCYEEIECAYPDEEKRQYNQGEE